MQFGGFGDGCIEIHRYGGGVCMVCMSALVGLGSARLASPSTSSSSPVHDWSVLPDDQLHLYERLIRYSEFPGVSATNPSIIRKLVLYAGLDLEGLAAQ